MDKTQTFADIGIPFRLYEAPIETCSAFKGRGTCSVCQREWQWLFRAGIGDDLIVPCSNCQTPNALRCDDQEDGVCTQCATPIAWPLTPEEDVQVCYDCLRAGRVAFTQDTDLGMIRWEDTQRGRTHGTPGSTQSEFESQPSEDDEDWQQYAVPVEDMEELNRTPSYSTWQGERWQFHCGRAMIYIGEPTTRPINEVSPELVAATVALVKQEGWSISDEEIWNSSICAYLFRCPVCGVFDGHSDAD